MRTSGTIDLRSALALGLCLSACGATPSAPREYRPMPTQEQVSTEAELVREPLRSAPSIALLPSDSSLLNLRFAFDAGSASDPEGQEGITRLMAQLMLEGGAGELSYAQLSAALYPMAAHLSVQVGRDETVFIGQVHVDHLAEFYRLFSQILHHPIMGEADFQRLRTRTQTALTMDMRGARDEQLGKEWLQGMLYEAHPYGHLPLGTEAGLSALGVDDLRAHRSAILCSGRLTIGLEGRLPEGFAERVAQDLSTLGTSACQGRLSLPSPTARSGRRVSIIDKPAARAVAVSMGHVLDLTRADADYPALTLATAWLGQHRQFVGRLMQAIRDQRGMNYGDYAYAEHFSQEGHSRFPLTNDARRQQYFSIWLRPLRPEQAHFGIRLAIAELSRWAEQGLSEEEFQHIRAYADRYLALYLQSGSRRLGFAMDDVFYGLDEAYLTRMRGAFSELTRQEVNAAIRRHIHPEQLQIAIVAPDAPELRDALVDDRPSPIEYRSEVPASVLAADRRIIAYPLGLEPESVTLVPIDQVFAR